MRSPALVGMTRNTLRPESLCHLPHSLRRRGESLPLVEYRAVISEPARTGSGNHAGKIPPSETSSQNP